MKAIHWSDNDRYWWRFTYSYEPTYRKFAVMLGSGDSDDYPRCRIRMSLGAHTLLVALPPIIKPFRRWHEIMTEPTRSEMIARGSKPGYWDSYAREYGFSFVEGSLHVHYGPQTHEWPGCASKVFFYPWREHRQIRHSLYDLDAEHFADLPEWGLRHKNGWSVRNALEAACPVARFDFDDYDGERITATCRIEEREYRRGKDIFRLLFIGRNSIYRSLDLSFSSEVGRHKGSWKGGTVGHSIKILPSETHEEAFRRYCEQEGLKFVGPSPGNGDQRHAA